LSDLTPEIDLMYPEIMVRSPEALKSLEQLNCVVIGPGLGLSNQAITLLSFWLNQPVPLVIDADALNLIASDGLLSNLLKQREATSIITPHPGEAARLLNNTSNDIQKNRIENALKLAQKYHAICVLKGANTVIAHENQYHINTTGNAGFSEWRHWGCTERHA
jgi:hydroxyethylthiazole kinase-like uncharacterized protein yjeF